VIKSISVNTEIIDSSTIAPEKGWLGRRTVSFKSRFNSQGYDLYSFFLRKV
jgi:hypothetical protein